MWTAYSLSFMCVVFSDNPQDFENRVKYFAKGETRGDLFVYTNRNSLYSAICKISGQKLTFLSISATGKIPFFEPAFLSNPGNQNRIKMASWYLPGSLKNVPSEKNHPRACYEKLFLLLAACCIFCLLHSFGFGTADHHKAIQ